MLRIGDVFLDEWNGFFGAFGFSNFWSYGVVRIWKLKLCVKWGDVFWFNSWKMV